jgi:hypothetical protein
VKASCCARFKDRASITDHGLQVPRIALEPPFQIMQCTDARIPAGYPAIYREFLVLKLRNGWVTNMNGSIPVLALTAYIEYQFSRVMESAIKMNTLHYYLSALKSIHDSNGIVWIARDDRRIVFLLKRLLRTPGIPCQEGTQDHAISISELKLFCTSLDINNLNDVVAGALSTCLFHGLGRTPELLHAPHHPPMESSALHRMPSPLGRDISYSITLTYPKMVTLKTQYITPLIAYGITSANFWIERLRNLSPYTKSLAN